MKINEILRLAATLILLWLLLSDVSNPLLSDKFNPLIAILGVASIALVCYFAVKMKVLRHKGQPLYFPFLHFFLYWVWLMVEIFKSNIAVAKRVMDPAMPIKPILKAIPAVQHTEIGKVIFANSITLTPGTVAINITKDDEILVHALHKGELDDLERGEMGPRVARLEPPMVAGLTCDISNDDTEQEKP